MSADILGCHNQRDASGIWCVETRDAANHTAVHRAAPHNAELSDPNDNSVMVERTWTRSAHLLFIPISILLFPQYFPLN